MSTRSVDGPPLGPGALADRLVELSVAIETVDVELGGAALQGYDEELPRPTAIVVLRGRGRTGRGECVAWTLAEQERFAGVCPGLVPISGQTLGALHDALADAEPYHAAAIEAAAIDLGLGQASTNLFALSGRPARPVTFCRSLGRWSVAKAGGPSRAVQAALAVEPWAHIKIDVDPEGWDESTWRALGLMQRIVVVDFKHGGTVEQVELAHHYLPAAWLEDPPAAALAAKAPWRSRIAVDGYVRITSDLDSLPAEPGAINVKPARMGGPIEALRVLERCMRRSWAAYVGGMFEAGPGRVQARVLASLFTADAWNDLAPLEPEPAIPSPLPIPSDFVGFDPRDTQPHARQRIEDRAGRP